MADAKTALIIGASRGLGLGLVRHLSAKGWQVTATVREPAKAEKLAAIEGVKVETVDIDDQSSLEVLSLNLKGQVFDLLYVNAGVKGPEHQSAAKASAAELGHLLMTNAVGPIRLAERLADHLRPGTGILAFMSSRLGSVACPDGPEMALYKASKAALNSLTNTFYTQLPENGRPTVLSMHPGWVRTEMGGDNAPLDIDTSIEGIVTQLEAYAGKGGHHFIDYQGKSIPW